MRVLRRPHARGHGHLRRDVLHHVGSLPGPLLNAPLRQGPQGAGVQVLGGHVLHHQPGIRPLRDVPGSAPVVLLEVRHRGGPDGGRGPRGADPVRPPGGVPGVPDHVLAEPERVRGHAVHARRIPHGANFLQVSSKEMFFQ